MGKFVSLLKDRALYFSRVSQFEDPFEGSTTSATLYTEDAAQKSVRGMVARSARDHLLACCWHMNNHESEAMWQLYSTSSESVAIQSTFSKLAACLPDDALLATVEYLDFDVDVAPRHNTFQNIVRKRKSFAHEQELRALIWTRVETPERVSKGEASGRLLSVLERGLQVSVDLSDLVETIRVNPRAPAWFLDVVTDLTHRYDPCLSSRLSKSDLLRNPVF
ncbi:MAG: hypothetical protein AAGH68_15515 [Pseudomonadota bacterium]